MRCGLASAFAVAAALLAGDVGSAIAADAPPGECDRLAAVPGTVEGVEGVAFDSIIAEQAVGACAEAVRAHPGVPRLVFQYARALLRAGDGAAAAWLYAWSAGAGYAPAQYEFGLALQGGNGIAADAAAAERWLAAAAAQGYPAPIAAATESDSEPVAEMAPEVLADSLERMAAALDDVAGETRGTPFDLAAALQAAGTSVDEITAWVARETALVPYRGRLRGATGVLIDRYGNSLDRALLLAELLQMAGYEVRLAQGAIPAAAAEALLDDFIPPPADPPPPIDGETLALRLLAAAGDESGPLHRALVQAQADAGTLAATVQRRGDDLAPQLLAVLGDMAGSANAAERSEAVAALSDHWWVQVRRGFLWVDADPSAAVVGGQAAAATLAVQDLPDAMSHAVTLRLIVEFWRDGALVEETVLAHRLVPADGIGRPIVLHQISMGMPPAAELLANGDPAGAVLAAAAEAWIWQPVLIVGDEILSDRLFTMAGEVLPATAATLNALGVGEALFGDTAGVADDAVSALGGEPLAPAPPDEATASVRVSAEWLEIEIEVAGAPPAIERRLLFDLIGPEGRAATPVPAPAVEAEQRLTRALALMREADIMVTGAAPAPGLLREVLERDTAELLRAVALPLRSGDAAAALEADVPRIPLHLYRYAALRLAADATAPDARPYQVAPNVALAWSGLIETGAAGPQPFLLLDIVGNRVGVPAGVADGFAARVAQGVRDTVVEDVLVGGNATGNAAALFEADAQAGHRWVLLDPAMPEALDRLVLPDAARSAIARDLNAGAYVVAPPQPISTADGPQVAWWRVDAQTGTTLGMSPLGGAAMAEYGFLLAQGSQTGLCMYMLGTAIAGNDPGGAAAGMICAAGGVGGAVSVLGGAIIGGGVITMVAAILSSAILLHG